MTIRQCKSVPVSMLLSMLTICVSSGQEETAAGDTNNVDEIYNRARYELIVEREPFGSEPLVDEGKEDEKMAQALEQEYRLCFLLENDAGEVRAGFQNKKPKKGEPKSVMLMVGESFGSMKLLDIDLKDSSAKLMYKGSEVSFKLEKPKVAAAAQPATPTTPVNRSRRFGGGFRRTTPPPEPEPEPDPEPQLSEEELAVQRAQVQENLQKYQMDVLRQGMPPLPVQLTPEQDAQLVEEGVLPPIEEGETVE